MRDQASVLAAVDCRGPKMAIHRKKVPEAPAKAADENGCGISYWVVN